MHVCAGGGPRHGGAVREVRDAEPAQVLEQAAALGTVGMHGHVEGVVMVEIAPMRRQFDPFQASKVVEESAAARAVVRAYAAAQMVNHRPAVEALKACTSGNL